MVEAFTFSLDGRQVAARPGQSLAAALAAAGILGLRETPGGRRRGIFCGMGVCQDCLVEVDGVPNRRACMERARPGLTVRRQQGLPELDPAVSGFVGMAPSACRTETPGVLVIGAGAGGLSAAIAASEAGADVLVIDERSMAGGQFYKQAAGELGEPPLDRQQRDGARLVERAIRSGARILFGAEVWGAFEGPTVHAAIPEGALVVRPRNLIVATGAYERPRMFPGWDLPGVMTTGAAQVLWRSYRVLPGARVVVAGNGPLNFQVARELMLGGAQVPLVAEAAPPPWKRPGAVARMMASDPRLAAAGAAMLGWLVAHRAMPRFGTRIERVEPAGSRLRVHAVSGAGRTRVVDVDAVCMNHGFHPQNEVLRLLGVEMRYDAGRMQLVPVRSERMETRVSGVFAVGDCCGLGGAPAALVEGRIAGRAAAERLGGGSFSTGDSADRQELERHRRFQAALWDVFAAAYQRFEDVDPDALVCRCEEVVAADLRASADREGAGIGTVKRETRAGMGRCQGRYCSHILAPHLARRHGRPMGEREMFAPRPPIRPVAIESVLAAAGVDSASDQGGK